MSLFARARIALRRECGFTMVEVAVAVALLALISAGLAPVFWASLRTAAASAHRSDASSLAVKATESIHAYPYRQVGFYGDQAGVPSLYEGHTTVNVGATTPASATPIAPVTPSFTVGPLSYRIERYIVWVDAQGQTSSSTSTTFAQAYKRTTIIVSWTEFGSTHTIRHDSIIYPGGLGTYSGPEGSTTTTTTTVPLPPSAPVQAAPTVPADPAGENEIDVSWTEPLTVVPVANFVVEAATDSLFRAIARTSGSLAATATSFPVTGLASGTLYYLRVRAVSAAGQSASSNTQSATTLTPPASSCTVTSLAVIGATDRLTKTYLQRGNNRLTENLNITVSLTGTCRDTYTVSGKLAGTSDPGSPYATTGSGNTRTGTVLLDNNAWSAGSHLFTVLVNGAATSPAVTQSVLVCQDTRLPSRLANRC